MMSRCRLAEMGNRSARPQPIKIAGSRAERLPACVRLTAAIVDNEAGSAIEFSHAARKRLSRRLHQEIHLPAQTGLDRAAMEVSEKPADRGQIGSLSLTAWCAALSGAWPTWVLALIPLRSLTEFAASI